jgi:elongation factor Tu
MVTLALQSRGQSLPGISTELRFVDVLDRVSMLSRAQKTIAPRLFAGEFASHFRHYASLECVGARRQIKGAAIAIAVCDAIVLVVDVFQGPMAQTREHALIARAFGHLPLVVFINGCDRVTDTEQIDLCELETRELLSSVGYDGDATAFVRGSAKSAVNVGGRWATPIDELIALLDREVLDPARLNDAPLCARILHRYDNIRSADTRAVVVELAVQRGTIEVNQKLFVWGRSTGVVNTEVRSLRVFDRAVPKIAAGDLATAELAIIGSRAAQRRALRRGFLLADQLSGPATIEIEVDLTLIRGADGGRHTPIAPGAQAVFDFWGTRSVGRMVPTQSLEPMQPGATHRAIRVTLQHPLPLKVGDAFVLSDGSDGLQRQYGGAARWGGTIGSGRVTQLLSAPVE